MWNDVLQKLSQLRKVDKHFQVFGAEEHHYVLHSPVSDVFVKKAESELGVQLPEALRLFYLEVGDGVAGPSYGLKQISQLSRVFEPDKPYPGIEAIKESAKKEGTVSRDGFFMAPFGSLTGLIPLVDEGCGHQFCVVATGSKTGHIVYVSADGFVIECEETLPQFYENWLDRELEKFEVIRGLMLEGKTLEEISNEAKTRFGAYNVADYVVSIADIQKPSTLFGGGNHKIYHGATQLPWYKQVLYDWQKENGVEVESFENANVPQSSIRQATDKPRELKKSPWYKKLFQNR